MTGQDHLIFDPLPADVQELGQGDSGISWVVKGAAALLTALALHPSHTGSRWLHSGSQLREDAFHYKAALLLLNGAAADFWELASCTQARVQSWGAAAGQCSCSSRLHMWAHAGHHHGDHRTNFLRAAIDRLGCVQTGGHQGVAALNAASVKG